MGSPQMNFLDAQIAEKGGDLIAKVGEYDIVIPAAKAKVLKDGGYVGTDNRESSRLITYSWALTSI